MTLDDSANEAPNHSNGSNSNFENGFQNSSSPSSALSSPLESRPTTDTAGALFNASVPCPFPYRRIHRHCLTCILPLRCIRKPTFAIAHQSQSKKDGAQCCAAAGGQPGLSMEEIYAMILSVAYYKNGLLPLDDDSLVACPVVRCPNDVCPVILHYCKLPEHFLLCEYQKMPCLNHNYGCPFTIQRRDIAAHLRHCPANVVHCSAEWNRWPLHATEKSPPARVYCPPHALDIRNLDVALALRDQRMLKQLWSASRQMKKIMRGCLSTHPAVPIKPYIGCRTYREYGNSSAIVSSDPSSGEEKARSTPVIIHHDEERVIAFASKLVEEAYHDSLVEILKRTALVYRKAYDHSRMLMTNGGPSGAQYQGRQKSNSICQMMLSHGSMPTGTGQSTATSPMQCLLPAMASMPSSSSINLPILSDSIVQSALEHYGTLCDGSNSDPPAEGSVQQVGGLLPVPIPPPVPKCNALSLEVSVKSLAAYHPKPRSMYTFRCGMDFRVDEIASHHRDIHSEIHGGLDGWIEHRCPLFQYGCSFVHRRWAPRTCGVQKTLVYNEGLEAFACSSTTLPGGEPLTTPFPDDDVSTQMTELSVSGRASAFTRKRGSSSTSLDPESPCSRRSSMSATCCSQSAGGSSKKYCSTLSLLSPTSSLSSSLLQSPFSNGSNSPLSSPSCSSKPAPYYKQQYSLNDFPFEILQYVCNYLDGYSLNNLSFTSQRLRLVVQSFLKKKGYVLLQWKRYETAKGKYRWSVAYKKWMFSTAIAPISGWTMDSDNAVAEHLRICPFNERLDHGTEPFQCIFLNQDATMMMQRQRP